jgi:hypothetical protein
MTTRKPVKGLAAPYIVENNIDVETTAEPLKIFGGAAKSVSNGANDQTERNSSNAKNRLI